MVKIKYNKNYKYYNSNDDDGRNHTNSTIKSNNNGSVRGKRKISFYILTQELSYISCITLEIPKPYYQQHNKQTKESSSPW